MIWSGPGHGTTARPRFPALSTCTSKDGNHQIQPAEVQGAVARFHLQLAPDWASHQSERSKHASLHVLTAPFEPTRFPPHRQRKGDSKISRTWLEIGERSGRVSVFGITRTEHSLHRTSPHLNKNEQGRCWQSLPAGPARQRVREDGLSVRIWRWKTMEVFSQLRAGPRSSHNTRMECASISRPTCQRRCHAHAHKYPQLPTADISPIVIASWY
jgi:hypothetical protein